MATSNPNKSISSITIKKHNFKKRGDLDLQFKNLERILQNATPDIMKQDIAHNKSLHKMHCRSKGKREENRVS